MEPLDLRVLELVDDLLIEPNLTPERVLPLMCKKSGLDYDDFFCDRSYDQIQRTRQGAQYVIRTRFGLSLQETANKTLRNNHVSTMHGINKISDLLLERGSSPPSLPNLPVDDKPRPYHKIKQHNSTAVISALRIAEEILEEPKITIPQIEWFHFTSNLCVFEILLSCA